ncbi:MAG: polyhydroxyalkanoate synthesis repressor PhaR [Rhodospirillaceae bacterium]|nr:polyhydroxyalkanoate synthesis repressor PhaR [Rhodospirillaceae bacterium]
MADKKKNAKKATKTDGPITIKKYANRRLYNTATSSYVTLDHLAQMVRDGIDFEVFDAKSGDDITRQVLTHIIVEEEAKGANLLPLDFLRQLIGLYGDSLQAVVPGYLDEVMKTFARNQDQMRDLMNDAFGTAGATGKKGGTQAGANPFAELTKQNMAMFENAMKMFNPFLSAAHGAPGTPGAADASNDPGQGPDDEDSSGDDEMEQMRKKLDALQNQLNELSKPKR